MLAPLGSTFALGGSMLGTLGLTFAVWDSMLGLLGITFAPLNDQIREMWRRNTGMSDSYNCLGFQDLRVFQRRKGGEGFDIEVVTDFLCFGLGFMK